LNSPSTTYRILHSQEFSTHQPFKEAKTPPNLIPIDQQRTKKKASKTSSLNHIFNISLFLPFFSSLRLKQHSSSKPNFFFSAPLNISHFSIPEKKNKKSFEIEEILLSSHTTSFATLVKNFRRIRR
jgi:hypothetical protein